MADTNYGSSVSGLSWSRDGRLASSSLDGLIRLYDSTGRRTGQLAATDGKKPLGLTFDPDGQQLAVGYQDTALVDILSGRDLSLIFRQDAGGGMNASLFRFAWSSDGITLYGSGLWGTETARPILAWGNRGHGPVRIIRTDITNTIMDLTIRHRRLLVAGADPAWILLDEQGQRLVGQSPITLEMRSKSGANFTVSANGLRLRFGLGYGAHRPILFNLTDWGLVDSPKSDSDLFLPRLAAKKLEIRNWQNETLPSLNGKALTLLPGEFSRSLSVAPNDQSFALGTEYYLRLFDAAGATLGAPWLAPATVRAINHSRDGRFLVAAYGDGTIRWHRADDLTELLALFIHADGKRWVAWTPKGYYLAGPGGEDLIGWHVNQGPDQAAEFYPASRFRDRFSRPDIVDLVLTTLDEAEAVRQADAAANRRPQPVAVSMTASLPPLVDILSPVAGDGFGDGEVTLRYRVRSQSGKAVTNIRILVDGRPASELRGLARQEGEGPVHSQRLSLPPRDVTVSVVAETEDGAGPVSSVALRWTGQTALDEAALTKPVLYVLAIGVSAYVNPDDELRYPAKDARDLAEALKLQEGGLYRDVVVKVIADASQKQVLEGFDWLVKSTTSRDVGMLFMAGHAILDERKDYWFLPRDADRTSLRSTAIPKRELDDTLSRLAGKAVLMLDTCHAGAAGARSPIDVTSLINELSNADKGVIVYASSMGKQLSLEDPAWGNGAFTHVLVKGLRDRRADVNGDGAISLSELDLWLTDGVKKLTDGRQHPVMVRPETIPNIPIAVSVR